MPRILDSQTDRRNGSPLCSIGHWHFGAPAQKEQQELRLMKRPYLEGGFHSSNLPADLFSLRVEASGTG